MPKTKPSIIEVPEMVFIMVEGKGNPNTCQKYKDAMEILYGLSYSIKMSKMNGTQPEGYFEYVVPPLEGFWRVDDDQFGGMNITDKERFCWISMIRQPEFVTEAVFQRAKGELQKKKPQMDLARTRLEQFIEESGYVTDITEKRWHHEIYLSDPRKAAPKNLKTVIRHPIRKAGD